jgi:hypothetical protein
MYTLHHIYMLSHEFSTKLNFDKEKLKKIENLHVFYMCIIVPYHKKTLSIKKIVLWKLRGLCESKLLNILWSNQTLILEDFLTQFKFLNIYISEWAQLSMIYMLLKWHRIETYNKNCREIDVLMRILAHLHLQCTPTSIVGD